MKQKIKAFRIWPFSGVNIDMISGAKMYYILRSRWCYALTSVDKFLTRVGMQNGAAEVANMLPNGFKLINLVWTILTETSREVQKVLYKKGLKNKKVYRKKTELRGKTFVHLSPWR